MQHTVWQHYSSAFYWKSLDPFRRTAMCATGQMALMPILNCPCTIKTCERGAVRNSATNTFIVVFRFGSFFEWHDLSFLKFLGCWVTSGRNSRRSTACAWSWPQEVSAENQYRSRSRGVFDEFARSFVCCISSETRFETVSSKLFVTEDRRLSRIIVGAKELGILTWNLNYLDLFSICSVVGYCRSFLFGWPSQHWEQMMFEAPVKSAWVRMAALAFGTHLCGGLRSVRSLRVFRVCSSFDERYQHREFQRMSFLPIGIHASRHFYSLSDRTWAQLAPTIPRNALRFPTNPTLRIASCLQVVRNPFEDTEQFGCVGQRSCFVSFEKVDVSFLIEIHNPTWHELFWRCLDPYLHILHLRVQTEGYLAIT